jgi:L-iditol 2-dehydrogenase
MSDTPPQQGREAASVPKEMRVGTMAAAHQIEFRTVPTPEPASGDVLVRIRAVAICTWEQRTYSGQQPNTFPFIGGHEIAGEIAAIGPNCAPGLEIGDLVAVGSASCGRCHWCLTGQDRACARHYAGAPRYGDAWGPGGFADFKTHPADGVYKVGDAPIEVASLTEPLSCAVHASRMLNPYVSEDVVVLGAGVMGLMNVVALKRRGARVIVSEIDAGRLAKAKAMGADELIDASKEDPIARVKELTEGRGTEAVICAFGGATANEQALAMLSEKGRMVLFAGAYPEAPLTLAPNKMHDHERQVIGVVSGDKQDFYIASRLIRHHLVDLSPLIQATYPLTQLGEALDASLKPGSYRVIVEP